MVNLETAHRTAELLVEMQPKDAGDALVKIAKAVASRHGQEVSCQFVDAVLTSWAQQQEVVRPRHEPEVLRRMGG
jgi:hypothetical protein